MALSRDSQNRRHYTSRHLIASKTSGDQGWRGRQGAIMCVSIGTPPSPDSGSERDVAAYFKGNEDRRNVFRHRLLHQHATLDMRSGNLKSGYRFLQPIYRLSDIV